MRLLTVGNRFLPWSTGGYEVVWGESVQWLGAAGHDVRVLTTLPDPSDEAPELPAPAGVHRELRWYWRDHTFPPVGLRAAASLERSNASVLARHLREFRPDAIVWWAMGGMSLSLIEHARRSSIPAVGAVGDEWMVYGPLVDGWMRRWRGRWRLPSALGEQLAGVPTRVDLDHAAIWLFNSRHLLAGARGAGWRLPRAAILPPGVDSSERFALRPSGPWRWRLLYCGRLDPRKGVATAIEALEHLPPEAALTIHGQGDKVYRAELEGLAARCGVAGRVRFTSSDHERVPDVYAQADVLVFPVRWEEPWGLVPLEAMAIGRPVVASRAGGGPAEYLEPGQNCLLFEPGNAVGLADQIRHLGEDPGLRGSLVAGGHSTALRYSFEAFHQGILGAIERAMSDRR